MRDQEENEPRDPLWRWKNAQLWTFLEAAFLLSDETPPRVPIAGASDGERDLQLMLMSTDVEFWYGEIKDAADLGSFKWFESRTGHVGNRRLQPSECIRWAQTRNRTIPAALVDLVKPDQRLDLKPKDRTSLLTMVIAMAIEGYGFDPREKKSGTINEVVEAVQRCGLNLSDDTVRKWLREASELVDPDVLDRRLK